MPSTSTATGAVATIAAASTWPQGTWYCPRNSAIATGTVCRSGPSVNDSAKRNSFQLYTNVRMAVAASPGKASGTITSRKARNRLAPSTIAASSSSAGSWRK